LEKLHRGESSESDVRNAVVQPGTVWEKKNGERTLEYPKGQAGGAHLDFLYRQGWQAAE